MTPRASDPAAAKDRFDSSLGVALGVLSTATLALRWHLAGVVGFGDAEALYASYALHPQPAYLDHPGLVGVIARLVGGGAAPLPIDAHHFTALVATALPWLGLVAARALGATWRRAFLTAFALAFWPEMSIGLFALTPDLPLAVSWIAALGLSGLALSKPPASRTAFAASIGAGLLAGAAILSKASGALLLVALVLAFASKPARSHGRTAGPWLGLVAAAILVFPALLWERRQGFPLLSHRLISTQTRAGFSLRNLGALAGGQLLYVTPPFLIAAYRVLRDLLRRPDAVDRLLVWATVAPGAPLVILCLWSRVAEPHWLAPAYLALAFGAARTGVEGPRLRRLCVLAGVAALLAGFVSVATPLVPRLSGRGYVPRYDLVNDLYSWQVALPIVEDELAELDREGKRMVVVGPHWTVCAQVHAALGERVAVGCRTPGGDDFSTWYPENTWSSEPSLLFVTDDRFPTDLALAFPRRDVVRVRSAQVFRGGRLVRTVRVARLDKGTVALLDNSKRRGF